MKENRTMRIAAVMLVFALLTTCIISGSFAKYVTRGTAGTDMARVAKWGVTVTTTGTADIFDSTYDAATPNQKDADGEDITVSVTALENVVAPGTKKDNMAGIQLSGTPEVAVSVTYTGSIELGDNWVDGTGAYYCPLIIKVGTAPFDGNTYSSADAFENAVNAAISTSVNYAPGTDLSTLNAGKLISWEWKFDNGETDEAKAATDAKDTALGTAATNDATKPTISVSLNATVTQID